MKPIRTLLGLALLAGAATSGRTAEPAARIGASALATSEQIAAEKTLLALLADPAIRDAKAKLVAELLAMPAGRTPDGAARAEHAVAEWTNSLILREISGDPARPAILWEVDNTPHSWFGHTIEGMAVAGDNPDHIYRGTFLDGAGRYEIDGRIDPKHRPVQFSFEVTGGLPGKLVLQAQSAAHPDMGNQIAMLTDRDIQVAPDGSFRLLVGGDEGGANHLRTRPGPISVNVRDVLSDWDQRPNRLTIRRLDAAEARPLDAAALRQRVLDDLPGYVRFWAGFKDTWFGGLKPNSKAGPVPRDGGWGYLAAARYALAPGQAILITTTRGPAAYTGVQITDPWLVAPDGAKHQTSLNISQAKPNADGSYTYVIAPTDPGVANWVDTAGLHDGYILLRWQQLPVGATADGLLRDFGVISLDEKALAGLLPETPETRRTDLAHRAAQYAARMAP